MRAGVVRAAVFGGAAVLLAGARMTCTAAGDPSDRVTIRLSGPSRAYTDQAYRIMARALNGEDRAIFIGMQPLIGSIEADRRPWLPHDQSGSASKIWIGSAENPEPALGGEVRNLARSDFHLPQVVELAPGEAREFEILLDVLQLRGIEKSRRCWVKASFPLYWERPSIRDTVKKGDQRLTLRVLLFGTEAYKAAPPGVLGAAARQLISETFWVDFVVRPL